jgi:steroid delta-isomerase-like uncharacterized protein
MAAPPAGDLKEIALQWMALWQGADLASFDRLHARRFIDRSAAGRKGTRGAFRKSIEDLYRAFPDFLARTEDVLINREEGRVAIRWTAKGTHRGPFFGFAPTGRVIRFSGIEILSVRNGRIVERWGEWDGLWLVQQLRARL